MLRLLTPEELSDMLGVSIHTVYQWTCKRQVPFIKVGKLVRFPYDEVLAWLEANKVMPQSKLMERLKSDGQSLPKK
ncbi:MAG TPA: helix-turn-helix domain-containing protein [Blastocatellia bacterium]|nr:helix-turn-helix domain-containing protein [Blastocatellia bacterium]